MPPSPTEDEAMISRIHSPLASAWLAALALALPVDSLSAAPALRQEDGDEEEAQDDVDEEVPGDVDAEMPELADPVESARRLVKHWGTARYVITRGRKEVGTYVQRNTIQRVGGQNLLEFVDTVTIGGAKNRLGARTIHALQEGLPILRFNAQIDVDEIDLAFEDGRVKGTGLMKAAIDIEASEPLLTGIDLLRGLPRVPQAKGASAEFLILKPEALPKPEALMTGTLRCAGRDDLEIEGETYPAWKYRWQAGEERPILFWYGEDGQLLRRDQRKEVWLLSPSASSAADDE
jgi:hypothetical protein